MTRAYKTLGWITTAAVLGIATAAHAHTLRLECKKITNQDVVCRAITSDGELARDIDIQLLATGDYKVLTTGKTNTAGEYAFKAPRAMKDDVGEQALTDAEGYTFKGLQVAGELTADEVPGVPTLFFNVQ